MSHSLNSLKGGYIGDCIGTTIGVIKGDTRSLDYSSNVLDDPSATPFSPLSESKSYTEAYDTLTDSHRNLLVRSLEVMAE